MDSFLFCISFLSKFAFPFTFVCIVFIRISVSMYSMPWTYIVDENLWEPVKLVRLLSWVCPVAVFEFVFEFIFAFVSIFVFVFVIAFVIICVYMYSMQQSMSRSNWFWLPSWVCPVLDARGSRKEGKEGSLDRWTLSLFASSFFISQHICFTDRVCNNRQSVHGSKSTMGEHEKLIHYEKFKINPSISKAWDSNMML